MAGFPAADVEKELNPGFDKNFQVDPVSSNVATSKGIKERDEAEKKEDEKTDALQSFKTAIIVSGMVVAVVGAIFAVTKKLREK
ncbi:uncharacterized protein LOC105174048 [Sesamum indicum]|uniref:Uncharacterized protein LOC105174048 n=1 Tax=Sesamum indicum TaxID=4182 RepID=A0A6I9U285_SESIN|nr:uncharacterized protein LOC105174048 [Sesamum indicum]